MYTRKLLGMLGILALAAGMASATVTVLPGTGNTNFGVTVAQQCKIAVPSIISFGTVTDYTLTGGFSSDVQTVTISDIVVTAGGTVTLSIIPTTATFLDPASKTTDTWASTDVSCTSVTWTGATIDPAAATMGTIGSGVDVVVSDADVTTLSTEALVFKLAAKATGTIKAAGTHTLAATWKVTSSL